MAADLTAGSSRGLCRRHSKILTDCFWNQQRPLRLGGGNGSSCPNPVIALAGTRTLIW